MLQDFFAKKQVVIKDQKKRRKTMQARILKMCLCLSLMLYGSVAIGSTAREYSVTVDVAHISLYGDAFKVRDAYQAVQVRTSSNEYVVSTWEKAIPNQGLAEQSAEEGCKVESSGMCCSHAVVGALEYCYQRSDLLASYLHKAVTGGYHKGMNLEEAMNFVKTRGVMALPPNQTVKHGSGRPWPDGPRYKFRDVINVDSMLSSGFPDKATKYKAVLIEFHHPIVVSILSGYKGYKDKSPFLKYRGIDPEDSLKMEIQDDVPEGAENVYHAVILYGFRESTGRFFIKNSWGPEGKDGLCTLPYGYVNKFARNAFIGYGRDISVVGPEIIDSKNMGQSIEKCEEQHLKDSIDFVSEGGLLDLFRWW